MSRSIPIIALSLSLSLWGRHQPQQAGDSYVETIPGTDVGFTMVYAPAGTFFLGSPPGELSRDDDEGPERLVALDAFWIGAHEVTHGEFSVFRYRWLDNEQSLVDGLSFDADAVSRPSPPYEDPVHGMGQEGHPAGGMTQWAALQYGRWLSEKTGRLYRLPTEAEWEYACRAGTYGPYHFGYDPAEMDGYAWYAANSGEEFHPVAAKAPNQWGLYDMLGNVAEWTSDQYDAGFYSIIQGDTAIAPWARPTGARPRTVRGGAFDDEPENLRCADRLESTLRWKRRDPQLPRSRWWNTDSPHVGFRLVRSVGDFTMDEIRAYWDDLLGSSGQ